MRTASNKLGLILIGVMIFVVIMSTCPTSADAQGHMVTTDDGSVYVVSTFGSSTTINRLKGPDVPLPRYVPPTRTYYSPPPPRRQTQDEWIRRYMASLTASSDAWLRRDTTWQTR